MTADIHGNEFVTDTMGLVLRLERRRLGPLARAVFEAVESGAAGLHVPAMVLAELMYLSERSRISASLGDVAVYFAQFPKCREAPLDLGVIRAAVEIGDIRELHDRLIAATARKLGLELVTNDPAIQASSFVRTLW